MVNLKQRSYSKELLDQDNIPFKDIKQNMKELETVNKFLGGHNITLAAIKILFPDYHKLTQLSICEIGCGGGDNLRAIATFFHKKNISVKLIGIDIKKECIDFAEQQTPFPGSVWISSDYKSVNFGAQKPDIIFSSLFCHHFTDDELEIQLKWMKENSTAGFFINDLQRNIIAYHSIKWITRIFSNSYLVKNDAPLSVARGFKRNDWIQILNRAGIQHYSLSWKWAFRYLLICTNG